jgi:hypothetical protein
MTTVQTTNSATLDKLLTPENSLLLLIDHQPFQFANCIVTNHR